MALRRSPRFALPRDLSPFLLQLLMLHRISSVLTAAEPPPAAVTPSGGGSVPVKVLPSLLHLARPLSASSSPNFVDSAVDSAGVADATAAVAGSASSATNAPRAEALHSPFGLPRRSGFGARGAASLSSGAKPTNAANAGRLPQVQKGPIEYLGGPVVAGAPLDVYLIYYGFWPAGSGQKVFENFVRSLSSSTPDRRGAQVASVKRWWEITAGYYMAADGSSRFVSSQVRLAGVAYDAYSQGKTGLSTGFVASSVQHVISSGKLPFTAGALYMVISSKDVEVEGFCRDYCGWHSMASYGSQSLIYGFQGHHAACPNGCMVQSSSPNGMAGIDATVSTLAHEIAEAATDPDLQTGWLAPNGDENADLCAWQYGNSNALKGKAEVRMATRQGGSQYRYNLVGAGGMRFLVQMNWDRSKQKCVIKKGGGGGGGGGVCAMLPGGAKAGLCRTVGRCC